MTTDMMSATREDKTPTQEGDLVTVIVNEATHQAGEAKADGASSVFEYGDEVERDPVSDKLRQLRAEKMKDADDRPRLKATVTALVTEVKPNGFMKIEGSRTLTINDRKETLSVRGIIRAKDVASDGTIFSTQMANADIHYTGEARQTEEVAPQKPQSATYRFFARIIPFL